MYFMHSKLKILLKNSKNHLYIFELVQSQQFSGYFIKLGKIIL